MRVYLLYSTADFEGDTLEGVFATRAAAVTEGKRLAAAHPPKPGDEWPHLYLGNDGEPIVRECELRS